MATVPWWWRPSRWRSKSLKGKRIAIPGRLTTAYLTLRLMQPDFEPVDHSVRPDSGSREGRHAPMPG